MQDDHFQQDLKAKLNPQVEPEYDALFQQGITTYTQLFALICDEKAEQGLRKTALGAIFYLSSTLDKRRAVPPLLAALNSTDEIIKQRAVISLGYLNTRRGTDALFALAADRTQPAALRAYIINALWGGQFTQQALRHLRDIMLNPDEDAYLRASAIECSTYQPIENPLETYIALLDDPLPEARFWAAYCLSQFRENINAAREALDKVVAFEHTLPTTWGWHVDREAMLPLETIYYNLIRASAVDADSENYFNWLRMYLISPAPEYSTLLHQYRHWSDTGMYSTDPLPEIQLKIDADWLADQLRTRWSEMRLNIRQPRPQAYLLDWHLQLEDKHLIGALHRDQYGVVLTGDGDLVFAFAAWYRGLFPTEQRLYLYEWADEGVEIKLGMTVAEIESEIV